MLVLGSANNVTPRFGPAAHTLDVGAGEEMRKEIFEVLVSEDFPGKAVSVLPFDLQKCEQN